MATATKTVSEPQNNDLAGQSVEAVETQLDPTLDPGSPKFNANKFWPLQEKVLVIVQADPFHRGPVEVLNPGINGYNIKVTVGTPTIVPRQFGEQLLGTGRASLVELGDVQEAKLR